MKKINMKHNLWPRLGNSAPTLVSNSDFMRLNSANRLYYYVVLLAANGLKQFTPSKQGYWRMERYWLNQQLRLLKLWKKDKKFFRTALLNLWLKSASFQLLEWLNFVCQPDYVPSQDEIGLTRSYFKNVITPCIIMDQLTNQLVEAHMFRKKAQAVFLSKGFEYIRKTPSIALLNAIGYGCILGFLLCYIGILVWNFELIGWAPIEMVEVSPNAITPLKESAAILVSNQPPPKSGLEIPYWPIAGAILIVLVGGLTLLSYQDLPEKFWYLAINCEEITPEEAIEGVASSSLGISEYFPVWYWIEATAAITNNFQVYDYPCLL